jgi:hypothetical protein
MSTISVRGISPASLIPVLIALSSLLPSIASGAPDGSTAWVPEIAVVWPHDLQGRPTSVSMAQLVNISVWPTSQVGCGRGSNPSIDLLLARNTEPASSIGSASRLIQRTIGGVRFPSEEFENVPANLAVDPLATYTFVSFVNGIPTGNVWVHAIDSRTFLPHPVVPTGYSGSSPSAVDTRIQIVFPYREWTRVSPLGVQRPPGSTGQAVSLPGDRVRNPNVPVRLDARGRRADVVCRPCDAAALCISTFRVLKWAGVGHRVRVRYRLCRRPRSLAATPAGLLLLHGTRKRKVHGPAPGRPAARPATDAALGPGCTVRVDSPCQSTSDAPVT